VVLSFLPSFSPERRTGADCGLLLEPYEKLDIVSVGHCHGSFPMAISDERFAVIGRTLRAHYEDIANEPLPERWVDLIRHLTTKERGRNECSEADSALDRERSSAAE
jgi:Anti-sigma factor NepR